MHLIWTSSPYKAPNVCMSEPSKPRPDEKVKLKYINALLSTVTQLVVYEVVLPLERHWDGVCVAVQLDGTMSKERLYNIVYGNIQNRIQNNLPWTKVRTRPSDARCVLRSQSWSCDACVSDLLIGGSSFASPPAFYSSVCTAVFLYPLYLLLIQLL